MKKQLTSLLLAVAMVICLCAQSSLFFTTISADENAVYVKQGASGNGTKDAPFGNINDAILSFNGSDGTVFVDGEYTLDKNLPSGREGMITVKGVDNNSVITVPQSKGVILYGDIVFKDIKFNLGANSHLNPMDNKFIMDIGNSNEYSTLLHLTAYANNNVSSSYAEFRSGLISSVHSAGAYCTNRANGCSGDSTIVINGATVSCVFLSADRYLDSHTGITIGGNLNIIVNSGTIGAFSYNANTIPTIKGALNIIFNNGTIKPQSFSAPDIGDNGIYIITSDVGGTISPTEEAGIFEVMPNAGKYAVINGQKIKTQTVKLNPGETTVTWQDEFVQFTGAQIRTVGEQGLRFVFSIPEDIAETSIEYGSVVMPKKYLGSSELKIGTVTTVNGKNYEAKKVPAEKIFKRENDRIYYTACVTQIAKRNYCSEYVAVPYVTYTDSEGQTVTKYGEASEKINVFSIASAASSDEACDETVKQYLEDEILSVISANHFFVKETATKLYGDTSATVTDTDRDYIVGDRYDYSGNLIKQNEVLYLDSLGLSGNSDDYFLSDILLCSYRGKIVSAESYLKKYTLEPENVIIERSAKNDDSYYVGANTQNEKVMTGVINFGNIRAYLDSNIIPDESDCKNSVRFFELSGKSGNKYKYLPINMNYDGSYGYDPFTGSYDMLTKAFSQDFPAVYNEGFYDADVYDSNNDGYADLVFIKNERLLKLDRTSGSYSGILTSDKGYYYAFIGNATVEGADFNSGDFVLAYENTAAKFINVEEVVLPAVYEVTDTNENRISFDNIPDVDLSKSNKYAFDNQYTADDFATGQAYTVYLKDGAMLYREENDGSVKYVLSGNNAEDYIKSLYEQSRYLTSDAIREGIDIISEQMKKDILYTPNTMEIYGDRITGTVYYVSEKNGKDTNDGKSISTPLKTINGLSSKASSLTAGDAVLFERDGVYRGRISTTRDGIVYGSYGEGSKPLIMQSNRNYADESLWIETEHENVWKCTQQLINVGVIGFDHDLFDYSAKSYKEIYGHIMNKNILGFTGVEDLNSDLQFYSDLANNVSGYGDLYLYSEYGNPGKRFASIEIGENLAIMSGAGDDVVIDNLAFKFTGGHGMGGAGGCKNRTVTNCVYSWLGGSVLSLNFHGNGRPVNYGNAVEIYGSCDGYIVDNCWMYQIYDTGVTHQYSSTTTCIQKGVRYLKNLIEFCHWGIEFYNANDNGALPVDQKYTSDVISRYNVVNRSGYGWGSIERQRTTGSHAYCGSSLSTNYDWYTEYNIFNLSAGNIITLPYNSKETPDKNIYVQYSGNRLGTLKGTFVNCDKNMKTYLMQFYGDKHPLVVIADPSELEDDSSKDEVEVTLSYGNKSNTSVIVAEGKFMIPKLPEDASIPEGKRFKGWTDNISNKLYHPGMPYEYSDTKVKLTAVIVDTGTITFYYGENFFTEPQKIGDIITLPNLPSDAVIPDGKVFNGWLADGIIYFEGSKLTITEDITEITAVFVDKGTICLTKRVFRPDKLSGFENPYASDGNYTVKGVEVKQETFDGYDVKSYKKISDKITAERTKNGTLQTINNYQLNLYCFDALKDSDSQKIRPCDAKFITVEYYYDTSGRDLTDTNGQDLTGKTMYYHQLFVNVNSTKTTVNWKANSTEGLVANKWHKIVIPLMNGTEDKTYFSDTSDTVQMQQFKFFPFGNGTGIQMYKGDVFYIKNITFSSYDPENTPSTDRTVKFYTSKSDYQNNGTHTSMTGLKDGDTFMMPAQADKSFFQKFKYWVRVGYDTQHTTGERFTLADRDDAIFYAVYGW